MNAQHVGPYAQHNRGLCRVPPVEKRGPLDVLDFSVIFRGQSSQAPYSLNLRQLRFRKPFRFFTSRGFR